MLTDSYNPDVLSCIANLSSDEVFTPPKLANEMLDLLPDEIWHDRTIKFLDPFTKTGVFLREITQRLMEGLKSEIPDVQERADHILKTQVYGIAITELTALLSRRTVYCSKKANGDYSVCSSFNNEQGNILYNRVEHSWENGRCIFCGANRSIYERDQSLEAHAYQFIHTRKPEEIFNMKFDVIVGNPPYQLETGGAGRQAKPIYHLFVENAMKLKPKYLLMIIPSRWFAGGMGLDSFRGKMLKDMHIERIVDFTLSSECFPGVDIAGGVCYFLWSSNYSGDCLYTYIDGEIKTTNKRKLDEFNIFVRNNKAINIIRKVQSHKEQSISEMMSPLGPFGLSTAERGHKKKSPNSLVLYSSGGRSFIEKDKIQSGFEYINKWKVIIGKATSAGAATAGKDGKRKVIATLDILEPNAVCTFSYFIGGAFDDQYYAINYKSYLATKFVRFLLLQSLSSININKYRFRFAPAQDFSIKWDDLMLYKKYNLSDEEIQLIESMISPME